VFNPALGTISGNQQGRCNAETLFASACWSTRPTWYAGRRHTARYAAVAVAFVLSIRPVFVRRRGWGGGIVPPRHDPGDL